MREVDRRIKDLQGKLASLAPTQDRRIEVKVFVAAGEALEADMVIRYQVRNASWTPFYDARLSIGTKAEAARLQLIRRASIRQNTGEAWDNVALSLSTARPTAGTAAPTLLPLIIDYEADRPPPCGAGIAPDRVDGGEREGDATVHSRAAPGDKEETTGGAHEDVATEKHAKVEVQAFQAVYGIPGRVTVPATGETKRVQIDEMKLDPTLIVRAVPEAPGQGLPLRQDRHGAGQPAAAGPGVPLP